MNASLAERIDATESLLRANLARRHDPMPYRGWTWGAIHRYFARQALTELRHLRGIDVYARRHAA